MTAARDEQARWGRLSRRVAALAVAVIAVLALIIALRAPTREQIDTNRDQRLQQDRCQASYDDAWKVAATRVFYDSVTPGVSKAEQAAAVEDLNRIADQLKHAESRCLDGTTVGSADG